MKIRDRILLFWGHSVYLIGYERFHQKSWFHCLCSNSENWYWKYIV